jgi:hypothetical protein
MSMPPLFLNLVIGEHGKTKFRLWLPLFLFIPFVYIAIALFDLIFVPLLVAFSPKGKKLDCARVALVEPFRILNATKGFSVDVQNPYFRVLVLVR